MATSDRRPYESATSLTQGLLDQCADNLEFRLEMAADVATPLGTIRASDRNKYVGTVFYEALCTFPVIKRTIGEWLSPTIEFSTLELPISNVDERFSNFLPGGANYDGWIGRVVTISLGLGDVAATYTTIYAGHVTDIGGLGRDRTKILVRTRDVFDRLSVNFPKTAFLQTSFPDLEDNLVGTILPVIYGDFTVAPLPRQTVAGATVDTAQVPAYVVNGKNAGVLTGATPLQLVISENDNKTFDTTQVWIKRGDVYGLVPGASVGTVVANRTFQITQGFAFDTGAYVYAAGDAVYVRVKGKDLAGYDDNIVWQARDILMTHAGALSGDFSSAWATYRDKASPAESAIAAVKSRLWAQDPTSAMEYVGSMFEQVRLEPFIDRAQTLSIKALHLDEFVAAPSFTVKQWDVQEGSMRPTLDDRNVWNRARGEYAFDPSSQAQARQTATFRNGPAITQAGKAISKKVIFPNLYVEADVVNQLKEMLRLASGYSEFIDVTLTPRAMLLDVGDFLALDVSFGSLTFAGTPAQVRELSFDPKGSIAVRLWSFQMIPFPGWAPGYHGITGGSTATITQE